jgi:hypothetical protein
MHAPHDEYDCLIPGLYKRLRAGERDEELLVFLEHELVEHFGLPPRPVPKECDVPARWKGVDANNYDATCTACKIFGPRGVAREYGIRSSDSFTVAEEYAKKVYRPAFWQAVLVTREGAIAVRRAGLNELRALLVTAPSSLRERLTGLGRGLPRYRISPVA